MSDLPPDPRPRPGSTLGEPVPPLGSAGGLRSAVAARSGQGGLGLIIGGALLLGVLTLVFLGSRRADPTRSAAEHPAQTAPAPIPPPPSDLAATEAASRAGPAIAPTQIGTSTPPAVAIMVAPPAGGAVVTGSLTLDTAALGRKAPALVVDLGGGPPPLAAAAVPTVGPGATGGKTGTSATGGAGGASGLNPDEQFAERVGSGEPERSRATLLRNTQQTIPQGAMIPGVLETALNSDLPGYTRAVVSRDVRGFDGQVVLVPRGSRVIGQYKSALSQGQSRAFVIWTRIIRPDGASIQIASSGTDPLGRAGLEGTVDRHFFERFGGAVLLSVINTGVASLARTPSTQVVIGSNSEASALGASVTQPTAISPTIKVPQGTPIRIFVARDLDFSPVGGIK